MAGDWGKIESAFKKLQPQIKKIDPKPVAKLIKQIKSALDSTWDAEDVFAEAIEAAQKGGMKGKKLGDYSDDKAVMKAFKVLRKEGEKHEDSVADLRKLSATATAPKKAMTKLLSDAKKQIDKKDKAQVKLQAQMESDFDAVKTVADSMGKLTPAEMFYGTRLDKVVERVINKSSNAAKSGPASDAEKLIEQKERDKNVKQAVKLAKNVAKLCDGAVKKSEPDPKAAQPYLKKAAELIKDLKALDTAYQTLKKKNAALIKASKDKVKIVRAIATIAKANDFCARRYSAAMDEVNERAP